MIPLAKIKEIKPIDVLLFASPGGHLDQLIQIYKKLDVKCLLVVDDKISDDQSLDLNYITLKSGERYLIWINIFKCILILFKSRPKVIISTGAGSALIFFILSKMICSKTIFIESIARVTSLSLTGRLSKKLVTKFYVQWPKLADKEQVNYHGRIKFYD
jgi:beta-1,4-N-acetylglucosaminyltransferase